MYKLKLIKGLSYSGVVLATQKKPYVETEDEAIANAAVASGYFELVDALPDPPAPADPDPDYAALSKMTKAELQEYATANGIDLAGTKTIADILQAISVHYGGSYTMMELQAE